MSEKKKVYVIPFSHLDLVWAGSREECLSRGCRIIGTALDLLDKYPEYRFLVESVNFLENYLDCFPGEMERVKRLIQEKRLEITNRLSYVRKYCEMPLKILKVERLAGADAVGVQPQERKGRAHQLGADEEQQGTELVGDPGVKEQVAGLFAQRLAELGYITIAADAAFQGASGGEPRSKDVPFYRTEDIHGMADYLSSYPGVDANRLGVLGICGGGGYTLNAAKSDKRFKAVATLSMFNSGLVRREGYMSSLANTVNERMKAASDARAAELQGKMSYSGEVDFDALTDGPCLAFGYAQAGQENSFTWDNMREGLEMQMPLIDSLRRAGKVRVETLGESGRWFRKRFPLTPATAVTTAEDAAEADAEQNRQNCR